MNAKPGFTFTLLLKTVPLFEGFCLPFLTSQYSKGKTIFIQKERHNFKRHSSAYKHMHIFKRKEGLSVGVRGEKAATNYLKKKGYKILARNFFNPTGRRLGEIDIIAKDGEEIVFIEVKTRILSSFNKSLPEESITPAKLYKLNKAASFYILKNQLFDVSYRFDAITLVATPENSSATVKHFRNIFI